MKFQKSFFKMTMPEQESFLIKKLQDIHKDEDEIKRMLATVRNGYKYEPTTDVDRPDLLELKGDGGNN